MTFGYRIKLYLFGFLIGLLILAFILKGKSCAGPSDLKLQELTFQNLQVSEKAACKLNCLNLKESEIKTLLNKDFKVNFEKSEPRANPFGKYFLERKKTGSTDFSFVIEDRDTLSVLMEVNLPKNLSTCDCK